MDDITSIIFDLGGVILDIDYKRTESAFQELGIPDFAKLYSQLRQDSLFDDLEMGLIDPQSFRERIRSFSRTAISDPQIDQAWNAILIGLPKENVDYLSSLKGKYRLFMLSNTNEEYLLCLLCPHLKCKDLHPVRRQIPTLHAEQYK